MSELRLSKDEWMRRLGKALDKIAEDICECGAQVKDHHPIEEGGPSCMVSPQVGHTCPCVEVRLPPVASPPERQEST